MQQKAHCLGIFIGGTFIAIYWHAINYLYKSSILRTSIFIILAKLGKFSSWNRYEIHQTCIAIQKTIVMGPGGFIYPLNAH